MLKPPFKLATPMSSPTALVQPYGSHAAAGCCEADQAADGPLPATRARLTALDPHLHCSIIGTCLSTVDLRKLMARFLFVRDSSELEVHHEAVRFASQAGPVAKALHKALDQRHEAALKCFSQAHDPQALAALWDEALRQGEIPGAYWALLTHRHTTSALRQKAFGDVHMLSHLIGAANRADIRRLVALEHENTELRERAERQQLRSQELAEARELIIARLQQELAHAEAARAAAEAAGTAAALQASAGPGPSGAEELVAALSQVVLQTERRERAEQAVGFAGEEASRLRHELEHLGRHVQALNRELLAAETQLREIGDGVAAPARALTRQLQGRRVFYVGGRPSSTPAIRDLVLRHGGEFQHHDGGLEDRKGLLASGVAWAQLVVFPVDCIDHDSAGNLKRLCGRQRVPFMALRGASVASFAAALSMSPEEHAGREPGGPGPDGPKHA
jgi:hypothetical protein